MPRSVAPQSMISGIRPSRLCSTCSARVGLIEPLALAEGAASGRPVARSSACIAGCAGTRRPIVGSPAVTSDAMPASGRSGTTSVSGPGQCCSASVSASLAELADPLGSGEIRHVHDQRVEARPALGLVDARDGVGVGRVGGEAVDRLGRHRDWLAGEDQPRGFGDRFIAEGKDPGLHADAAQSDSGAPTAGKFRRSRARSQAPPDRCRDGSCARGSPAIPP